MCAVADDTHDLFVSTRPAGGASSWSSVPVDPAAAVTSVSCPSTALCVAVDDRGDVLSTTTPTGGTPVWSSAHVDPAADNAEGGIYMVSCPSVAFCAAVDDQGNVLTSSDPAGGAPAWRTAPVYTGMGSAGGLLDLSCPSQHLCAAVDGSYGDVLTSTDPSGPSKAWKGTQISPGINQNDAGSLDLIHCDFTTICIAADNLGHVYSSTHPTAGGPAWSTAEFELADVSCPTRALCVAVEGGGSVRLARPRA
jgi:hypothetical protein